MDDPRIIIFYMDIETEVNHDGCYYESDPPSVDVHGVYAKQIPIKDFLTD